MQISGLIYIPNYITAEQEANFLVAIESGAWQTSLKRRVQH
jgi:hypothetical protein